MKILALFITLFFSFSASAQDTANLYIKDIVASHPNDPDCLQAWQYADKAVHNNPAKYQPDTYLFVGIYTTDDKLCQVFNIKRFDIYRSRTAYDVLVELIIERMERDGAISRYESILNGKVFRLYPPKAEETKT